MTPMIMMNLIHRRRSQGIAHGTSQTHACKQAATDKEIKMLSENNKSGIGWLASHQKEFAASEIRTLQTYPNVRALTSGACQIAKL